MSASASAAPAAGSKRAREPTEAELASQELLARLFAPDASAPLNKARALLAKQPPSVSDEERAAKKARVALEKEKEQAAAAAAKSNPFIAAMDASAKSHGKKPAVGTRGARGPAAFTANGAASLSTTKAHVLDLFYHMSRGYSRSETHASLELAWKESAERTLQVLCHARDCHGEGKGERLVSYHALLWLRAHKPRTYLANLLTFLSHGYFKDLLNLVEQIDAGLANPNAKVNVPDEQHMPGASPPGAGRKGKGGRKARAVKVVPVKALPSASQKKSKAGAAKTIGGHFEALADERAEALAEQQKARSGLGNARLELEIYAGFLKNDYLQLKAWQQQKKAYKAQQAALAADAKAKAAAEAEAKAKKPAGTGPVTHTSWFDDEDEPVNHDDLAADGWEDLGVSEARKGVEQVSLSEPGAAASSASAAAPAKASADVEMKDSAKAGLVPEPAKSCFISLAAKYAPSERKHYASQAKRLAKILFGGEQQQSSGFSSAKHMQVCLKKYRQLLTTLRNHLCLTERLACEGRWESVNFNAVPSRCHQRLKAAFVRHCGDRYAEYLAGLKKGVGKINVTGLEPHQLVEYYLNNRHAPLNETVEAAWTALVAKTKESGTFQSAVAVVDVSGSMSGTPMLVAIALGLLISELTTGPYQGRVLTFHEKPTWFTIQGETLKEKVASLASAPWGGSTNFQASFDLMLDVAVQYKIAQEQLPSVCFVFSDMQFDAADRSLPGTGKFLTNFESIKHKWRRAGYSPPGLVFWNLNGALNKDCPVQCDQAGCALMSGFSASLMGVFLRTKILAQPMDQPMDGVEADKDPEAEALANPLHPLAIMMDSIGKYTVTVDPTEED